MHTFAFLHFLRIGKMDFWGILNCFSKTALSNDLDITTLDSCYLFESIGGSQAFYFALIPLALLVASLFLLYRQTNLPQAPKNIEL